MRGLSVLKKGFTIVELLIVIVVVAILAAIVIVSYGNITQQARNASLLSDIDNVEGELTRYITKHGGVYDPALNWDSSNGVNPNIPFTPSNGNVIEVTMLDDGYCIRAYNQASDKKDRASAATKGVGEIGCSSGFMQVITATGFTCGLSTARNAYCWGLGTSGQLGNSTSVNSNIPVAVSTSGALAGKTIKQLVLETSNAYACVIASDDNAYCWGNGTSGQLGNGASVNSNAPVAVSTSGVLAGKTIKKLSMGNNYTCAIASDNNAYCWGLGTSGQLGNSTYINSNVPVAVNTSGVLSGKTIKQLSMKGNYTCVIASDDNAYCWGSGTYGKLGHGTTSTSNVPVAVTTSGALAGKTIKQIALDNNYACAIASDNNAYCWGYNGNGRLGNGTTTSSTVPVAVTTSGVLSGKGIKQLTMGNTHTCAIASDNNAYCWGYNVYGQLGNDTTTSSTVPVAVTTSGALAGKTIKQLSNLMSTYATCAIASDNNAYCWGYNGNGKLGNGTTTASDVPTLVTLPNSL